MEQEKNASYILIVREITGQEHQIPMHAIERKVCHNTLVFGLMADEKKKKKRR